MSPDESNNTSAGDSYCREIVVSAGPDAAYRELTEGRWWTAPRGKSSSVGDTPVYDFGPTRWKMLIKELIPGKRVVWECIEARLVDKGIPDRAREEWLGTTLIWEIEELSGGARVRFTHQGLVPALACYKSCSTYWDYFFLGRLQDYLNGRAGSPTV